MEKQLSYIANHIVIESVMQKENLNMSVDVVHPTKMERYCITMSMENALHNLRTDTIISAGDTRHIGHLPLPKSPSCNPSVQEVLLYTGGEQ